MLQRWLKDESPLALALLPGPFRPGYKGGKQAKLTRGEALVGTDSLKRGMGCEQATHNASHCLA